MYQSYKIRLLPTEDQAEKLDLTVRAARFAWNWTLDWVSKQEQVPSWTQMDQAFRKYRNNPKPEDLWLRATSSSATAKSVEDLHKAFTRFFSIQKKTPGYSPKVIARAKRKGRELTKRDLRGHPKFKAWRAAKPAFGCQNNKTYFQNGLLTIPGIKGIQVQTNYELPRKTDKIYNPRVQLDGKKWLMTFGREVPDEHYDLNDFSVGVDVGLKDFAVISYGENQRAFSDINKSPRVRKLERQRRKAQRKVSRSVKGSKRRDKKSLRVKRLYGRLANIRRDYCHKTSTEIVSLLPKRIVTEDLNIVGMLKNKKLSRRIAEADWRQFLTYIDYKAKNRGIEVVKADRFYPSSKTCFACGATKAMPLKERTYSCDCGYTCDRDVNAAKNLEHYGAPRRASLSPILGSWSAIQTQVPSGKASARKREVA